MDMGALLHAWTARQAENNAPPPMVGQLRHRNRTSYNVCLLTVLNHIIIVKKSMAKLRTQLIVWQASLGLRLVNANANQKFLAWLK